MREAWVKGVLSKIEFGPKDACWGWRGATVKGRAVHGRRQDGISTMVTHRVMAVFTGEPPPPGMEAHHVCENPACVNPWHLVPMLRSGHRHHHRKSPVACPKGHPYTPENVGWVTKGGNRCRYCKRCNRERAAAYKARQNGSNG